MDRSTILGLGLGIFFLIFGMGVSSVLAFVNPASLMVTYGGTVGSLFIHFTWEQVMKTMKVAKHAFSTKVDEPKTIIDYITQLSEKARREGILSIDKELKKVELPFLVKGLQLVIDGSDEDLVKNILNIEKDAVEERHKVGISIFEALANYAPAWGMIGTIIGLILMLRSLDDPTSVGPAMAVALLTTFYGAVGANLLFLPIAGKLKTRHLQEMLAKDLIIAGVLAIQGGDNPRTALEKLVGYISPQERAAIEAETQRPKDG